MSEIHLTKVGKEKIDKELHQLITVEREELKVVIAEARALGDLKENAEYHAAKEKQSHLEGRISELQGIVATAIIVDVSQVKSDKIVFGAFVKVIDIEKDQESSFQIVGHEESDSKNGKISYKSPLGKSLIGKSVGDEVIVKAPKGDIEYEILSIEYGKS
ncbi:transcription elongation factor GreA [bacterium]|nr:transcription elongation factor GreA [bacterium]